MTNKYRILAGTALVIAGVLFSFSRTDREFIGLTPSDGGQHIFLLESDKIFEQKFKVYRKSLTRLGLYMYVSGDDLPAAPIRLQVKKGGETAAEQIITPEFINIEGPTIFRFPERITTEPGEELVFIISAAPELNRKVGVKTRQQDGTFNEDAVFSINGAVQPNPLAYTAYYGYTPPIGLQIGGLAFMAGIFLIGRRWFSAHERISMGLYALSASFLFAIPAASLGGFPAVLTVSQAVTLYAMYWLLRQNLKLEVLPALFGAHIVAFSTWFPLHAVTPAGDFAPLSLRDTLFDPNQTPFTHGAGSYLGLAAAAFAAAGLAALWRPRRLWRPLLAAALLAGIAGGITTVFPGLGFVHGAIGITFSAGVFGACGMRWLREYLGSRSRLAAVIVYAIAVLVLLDYYQVATIPLEHPYLP